MTVSGFPIRPLTMGELLDRAFSFSRMCYWKWVVALVAVCLFATAAHAVDDVPISLDAYWGLVETTHARLAELAFGSDQTPLEEADPAALNALSASLEELAVQWDAVTTVELPDGTLIPVDTHYITAQLRADAPDLPLLAGILEHILATRETWPQGNFGSTDLAKLESVLRQPEFQWQEEAPNPIQEFFREVYRRINNAYIKFLEWLFPNSDGVIYIPLDGIITLFGSILLLVIFAYILRGTWGSIIAEAENTAFGEGDDIPLTSETARQRARQLSQAGDHRTAIRYLYLASLLLLEERGLLRYDRSLTNRETLRSVEHRPDLAAPLKDVVETFDRTWYGYQEVDQPTFDHYAERVDSLSKQK